jgi:hypothetical protein
VVRQELVRFLEGKTPQTRRVCIRPRHHETQDLQTSIREILGYGIKSLHSIKDDGCERDKRRLFWLARWRKYLRGEGLKGSRISINLGKFVASLGEFWTRYRAVIFNFLKAADLPRWFSRIPERIRAEYMIWKLKKTLSEITCEQRPAVSFLTLFYFNNWSILDQTESLARNILTLHGTRFFCGKLHILGFRSRAPPNRYSCSRNPRRFHKREQAFYQSSSPLTKCPGIPIPFPGFDYGHTLVDCIQSSLPS